MGRRRPEHRSRARGRPARAAPDLPRRFRFPKNVLDEEIAAEYTNGILEVRLPIETGAAVTGREIEVQA